MSIQKTLYIEKNNFKKLYIAKIEIKINKNETLSKEKFKYSKEQIISERR